MHSIPKRFIKMQFHHWHLTIPQTFLWLLLFPSSFFHNNYNTNNNNSNHVMAMTVRYRSGYLVPDHIYNSTTTTSTTTAPTLLLLPTVATMTVLEARHYCRQVSSCIAFSFQATTRFPSQSITVYFFPYPDWHVRRTTTNATTATTATSSKDQDTTSSMQEEQDGLWTGVFVDDPQWHSYINTTREKEAVPDAIQDILLQLKQTTLTNQHYHHDTVDDQNHYYKNENNKLRGAAALAAAAGTTTSTATAKASILKEQQVKLRQDQTKVFLLDALFYMVVAKEHRLVAAPILIPPVLALAKSIQEESTVRESAMRVLTILADIPETGPLLWNAGTFQAMKQIVDAHQQERKKQGQHHHQSLEEWDGIAKAALDLVSNICLYRSVNRQLRDAGAYHFLRDLVTEPGFAGVQATMALTHLGDRDFEHANLPIDKVKTMITLLQSAMDGDVAFGIQWDLIPGPLSAIKYLVLHSAETVRDELLDAGLMEELLILLETSSDASDTEMTLEIMYTIAAMSDRARHMILLAEHTLHETEEKLYKFGHAAKLASQLKHAVQGYDDAWRTEL